MPRSLFLRTAHVSALFALAVAQPLLDLLGRNAEFFVARGSSGGEIAAFAAIVCFAAPCLFLLVEWIAPKIHLALVAFLAALLFSLLLRRAPAWLALPLAPLLGVGFAALYRRSAPIQTLLSVLAMAPLIVAALFLYNTRAAGGSGSARVARVRIGKPAPVVLIVFDELSGLSLMDEKQQIDAARYPNFGELAKQATWYRNATTVNFHTEVAVPALLTGRFPERQKLQNAEAYPENVFTLLGGSYRLNVFETLTRLCPDSLCATAAARQPPDARLSSMLADAGVVYAHLVLPPAQAAAWLPPIDDRWGGFAGGGEATPPAKGARPIDDLMPSKGWRRAKGTSEPSVPALQEALEIDRATLFQRFLDSLDDSQTPTLHFLHILVPHTWWRYLPSGRDYGQRTNRVLDGVDRGPGVWVQDEWQVAVGAQRYMLQVGYVDFLLGKLIARLRQLGLYDRSLIVITADHGVTTMPGEPRRTPGKKSYPELLAVPFFVKLPGQTEGAISDRNVQTIDMLPTIADALGIELPWKVDGHSALDSTAEAPGEKTMVTIEGDHAERQTYDAALPEKQASLERIIATFGTGATRPNGVWAIGPYRDLVGQPAPTDAEPLPGARAFMDTSSWANIDLDGIVPARVTGTVRGARANEPIWVALAVNGTIAAVTRTTGSKGSFVAMVSDSLMRQGANEIVPFIVREENGAVRLYRGN